VNAEATVKLVSNAEFQRKAEITVFHLIFGAVCVEQPSNLGVQGALEPKGNALFKYGDGISY